MTDASGMTIFYTHVLRQYDAGIMIVGQYWIDLQPKKKRVVVTGECSPECSDKLIEDEIYITSGYNHMHYLGKFFHRPIHYFGTPFTFTICLIGVSF